MTEKTKSILMLIATIVAFQAIGGALGTMTSSEIATWYAGLTKSPLTPPGAAFGIAWTALYLMLAIAFWRVWNMPRTPERSALLCFFIAHMVLNWAWTPVFFTAHMVLPALVLILVIWGTAIALCAALRNRERIAAIMFVPYIVWLSFASYLNFYIWQYN